MQKVIINENLLFFDCPHCSLQIIVSKDELNCRIFRHAIYKSNYKQIDPHLSFDECQLLIKQDKVFGCCKPFQIIVDNNNLFVQKCDYI
jgi:hypothetical protein